VQVADEHLRAQRPDLASARATLIDQPDVGDAGPSVGVGRGIRSSSALTVVTGTSVDP
jgi:hypothetical protein